MYVIAISDFNERELFQEAVDAPSLLEALEKSTIRSLFFAFVEDDGITRVHSSDHADEEEEDDSDDVDASDVVFLYSELPKEDEALLDYLQTELSDNDLALDYRVVE